MDTDQIWKVPDILGSTDMVLDQTWVHVFKYLNYALQLKATRVEAVCMGL